jgi:hypothetical protein
MKRSLLTTLIFSVVLMIALPMYGALSDYTFSQSAGTYNELTTPTIIHPAGTDDSMSGVYDIGFTFILDDLPYTQFKANSNGFVTLNTASTASLSNALATNTLILGGFWDDLMTNSSTGSVSYQLMGTAPNRILVVQFKDMQWYYNVSTNLINYQIKLYETTNVIEFVYGAFGTAPGTSASASIGVSGAVAGNYMSITPGTPSATYSTTTEFTAINGTHVPYITGAMYTFAPPVAVPNDLQALSITGNLTPTSGTATTFDIQVRNRGTAAQSTYTVKLMSGTTELESVAGPAIQPNEILTVTVTHTFTATGPITVFGRVVLTGDQNTNNDNTAPINLNVQAAGTVAVTIGAGDQTARYPLDFYWKNSLYECLYMSGEINMGGLITGIALYNNFADSPANGATKLWIGETTNTDLSAGWIPSTQLTQVFDGIVTYPTGQNTITITFTTPYAYGGGNLVLMANRPMDTQYYSSSDYFQCQTVGTNRARYLYSDTTTFDPTNPDAGTVTGQFPKATLYFITQNMGALQGTVTSGGNPLEGALVHVVDSQLNYTTTATGAYNFPFVEAGAHQVTCSKLGYVTQTQNVTIIEDQTATLNFVMVPSPVINVTGTVLGSDTGTGLADATVVLSGVMEYTGTTGPTGAFTITNVLGSETYTYTITKAGYAPATGSITVGTTNYAMGNITLNEMAYPPTQVQAVEAAPNVNVTWVAPDPNAVNITEGFEADTFPPDDWTQVINNTDPPNTYGVGGTWCRVGNVALTPAITPPEGSWQCMMWWSYSHQDEWIITPQFVCPAGAALSFQGYIFLGSTNDDHYYVQVSTDNGSTWTVIWDAVAVGGGAYSDYSVPFVISLDAYAGQQIKIAWHADDPNSTSDGMWNVAAFDNVMIGSPTRTITFAAHEMEIRSKGSTTINNTHVIGSGMDLPSKAMALGLESSVPVITHNDRNDRSLEGYKVWRLLQGQEDNEPAWTLLTTNPITATAYQDAGWATVPDGMYKWAIKAVYTGDVMSTPALSNAVQKLTQIGTIAGIVRETDNTPISGATITVGTLTATSNATGAYSIQVPAGTHTVTCSAPGYVTATQTGVVVVTGQTTTLNFVLAVSSLVTDGFETYTDFAIDFPPWVNVDVDLSPTYGYNGFDFPGEYQEMAFMIFNPLTTTPASTDLIGAAHGGDKMAHCWAATTPPNNDWLISQQFTVGTGASVGFWARSLTDDYGLERFKVGVSNGGTVPADFTIISPGTYVQAPVDWTYYEYDIPATFIPGTVRVGINCVSNDAFIFMVDDFVMDLGATANEDPVVPVINTALHGNFPNPFNPETTISYSVKGTSPVTVEIYNTKGQKVKTLVNETKGEGNYTVKWDGTDNNNQKVTSGVYFYRMNSGKYTSSKKMILMK